MIPQKQANANNTVDYALAYASLGWKVFPVAKNKVPIKDHELGLTGGFYAATSDPDTITKWWTVYPDAGIAVRTGAESGIFAVDVDVKDGAPGMETLKELFDTYDTFPTTVTAETGSKGRHYLFSYPNIHVKSSSHALGRSLDIKGDGGYIIVAPSSNQAGAYRWWEGKSPFEMKVAQAPDWLLDIISKGLSKHAKEQNANKKGRVWKRLANDPSEIGEGGRNDALTSLGGWMRSKGAEEADILATLLAVNENRCKPPLDPSEVERIAQSVAQYAKGEPDKFINLLEFNDTDFGNAERLIKRHGHDIKFCSEEERWYIWDGKRWVPDHHNEVNRMAVETLREFFKQAQKAKDEFEKAIEQKEEPTSADEELLKHWEKRVKFALYSENDKGLKAMVKQAANVRGVRISSTDFDNDPYLLNLPNGTYDLNKCELRPHQREDLITHMANVSYNPKSKAPRWEQFIDEITGGDKELGAYFQRLAGKCLSGDTKEEHVYIGYGGGGNGKGMFFNTIMSVLGEYAAPVSGSFFMEKKNGGQNVDPELKGIKGKRLVLGSESSEGQKLNLERMKTLSGNDMITVRSLYEKHMTSFKPQAKYVLITNHKPMVFESGNAIWRRLFLIPFEISFDGKKRDLNLRDKLQTELEGILSWMIEGWKAWKERGIDAPEKVLISTKEYKEEMDNFGEFLEECCIIHAEVTVEHKHLYSSYKEWAIENGFAQMNKKTFERRLKERGDFEQRVKKVNGKSERHWFGIGLRDFNMELVAQLEREERERREKEQAELVEPATQAEVAATTDYPREKANAFVLDPQAASRYFPDPEEEAIEKELDAWIFEE